MPVRPLPPNPDLAHLKHQAHDLLRDLAARLPWAAQRVREFHPKYRDAGDEQIFNARLKLSDAQLAIARERGFPDWARLKRHIAAPTQQDKLTLKHHERIEDPAFRQAVDLLDTGDVEGLRALLRARPGLVRQHVLFEGGNYFRSPALLDFIAENPIRHGRLPPNIVEVAQVILDAGPDDSSLNETLMLVATGSVPRECGVQAALIRLLCRAGADPGTALPAAVGLNEHPAARTLMECGAVPDLPSAAGLGLVADFHALLPASTSKERHLALSLAAQFGHVDIVRALLDAGEDPDRYTPPGGHAHATPLHLAAAGGHLEVVRLLVERGARLDLQDVLWHGTPAGWAAHEGRTEVEKYLRRMAAR